jgi:hypothetical protein
MIIPANIAKKAILGVISPHGSTDLIHASQNGLVPKLFQIQAVNVFITQVLQQLNQGRILDVAFFFLSAMHFRHDLRIVKSIPKAALILFLFNVPEFAITWFLCGVPEFNLKDVFLFYMTMIHVPNHYRMSWKFIKKQKRLTALLVGSATFIFLQFGKYLDMNNISVELVNLAKAFVISHIIYNERYVYKKELFLPPIVKYI